MENAASSGRGRHRGPGGHQRALFRPLLNHRGTPSVASLCIGTVAACPASGIQVVWLHGWLPSSHPPSSSDSLGFCAHTQRAPLRAHRCGLGSAPAPLQAQPGLLGWHNQPNVKGPCQPLSSGARPCWPGPGVQRRPQQTHSRKSDQQGPPSSRGWGTPDTRHQQPTPAPPGKQATFKSPPSSFPRCLPRGLDLWMGRQLPHYSLSFLEGAKGWDQPGSLQRQVGGMGPKCS